MKSYTVGYRHEVREKGELCDSCGHDKECHSTVDTICYAGENGKSANCKCGCQFPIRVRIPTVGVTQEVNLNIKKPQFRPQRCQAKILKVLGAEQVYHRNYGSNVYVLCEVELRGRKVLAYVEWVDEK
jgi:hypothetical protein